ncbi:MAG: HAMP domain-containing sensor histidine kinase [Dehalococcoidia bacterium]
MSGSLGFRIFGGYGLVILLTLGVAGIVFFSLLGGYRQALDRNSLQQLADQVLFGVDQFASRTTTAREVALYLQTQSQETGALVFVLDADGRVVRDLSPAAEFDQLHLPITLRDVRSHLGSWVAGEFDANGETLPFLARVVPVGRLGLGAFIAIALPDAAGAGVVGDLVPRLLISGLVGLAVALIVGLLISRSIYNPLRRLTAAVAAVGRGQYDTRVPEEGPQETKELARALNRMTQQVRSNEKTLQDFMADVSHELRTPLTSIRGFTQALMDGTVQDSEQRQRSAQVIDDEARRMLRLVEDLLELSRMEAGEFRLQRESVDPAELVTHVTEVFSQRAADKGLELRVELPPALPRVSCDFDRIVQVLTNLVDNAIQHTHQGSVSLGAASTDSAVTVIVRDTGEGIPPDDLERLFDRFYRGERTGQRRGSGLGLAISREIVRAHGGEIDADSVPGLGTSFRITLPTAARPPRS